MKTLPICAMLASPSGLAFLPDICFGVAERRSATICRRLAAKKIKVSSVTRRGDEGLSYLEFATDAAREKAVNWICKWYADEIYGVTDQQPLNRRKQPAAPVVAYCARPYPVRPVPPGGSLVTPTGRP